MRNFTTSDLPLVTYLACQAIAAQKIITLLSGKVEFTYDLDLPEVEREINKFQLGSALVEPATFYQMTRRLLATIKRKLAE